MKEKIVLIGGGGHCTSVIDVIEQQNRYEIIGIVDKKELIGTKLLGYDFIGCDDDLGNIFAQCPNVCICVGHIYSNEIRKKLFNFAQQIGFTLPNIISPFAYVSKHAQLGTGNVIMHHALINANSKIGDNNIINSKALIEHDTIVHNHCHISTGAIINGGVEVLDDTFIGSNSTSKEYTIQSGFIKAGRLKQ